MDPKKVKSVQNWPVPETMTEARSFVGLMRKFIPVFSSVGKPLHA